MIREFNFDKHYEIYKVGGKEYHIDFSDENRKRIDDKYKDYSVEATKLDREATKNNFDAQAKNVLNGLYIAKQLGDEYDKEKYLDLKEREEKHQALEVENRKQIKNALDAILGDGAFDELYEASGKSTINMTMLLDDLVLFLGDIKRKKHDNVIKKYKK